MAQERQDAISGGGNKGEGDATDAEARHHDPFDEQSIDLGLATADAPVEKPASPQPPTEKANARTRSAEPDEAGDPSFTESRRALGALAGALKREAGATFSRISRPLSRPRDTPAETEVPTTGSATPEVVQDRRDDLAPPPRRPRRGGWVGALAAVILVWAVVAGATMWWALRDVPWQQILDGTQEPVVVLQDANGDLVVQEGPYRGAYATLDQYPQHFLDAVLSIEDRRFHEHYGVDLRGMARALMRNLGAGQVIQGGSTITQQLVKVLYLERDRTYRRKLQEAVIAFWLEARLGKEEILTRYLNNIYLGAGATGVPAAARVYFDKPVEELELWESAIIAGLIQAPSQLNPLTNPDGARERAGVVLNSMVANGTLEADSAQLAHVETASLNPSVPVGRSGSWFADWAMDEARQIAGPYRGTIRVRTTLVPELQEIASRVVTEIMAAEGETASASQAALVAMRPDGAVLAMAGGLDYGESAFNRAVTAKRQPGSTFKLFVYYAALKAGIDPRDIVVDEPVDIDGWAPENFGGNYSGRVSVAEAFARSLNAATVAIAQAVGIDNVAAAARELGIDAELMETPSLALGTSEVSLLDLTGAYASVRAGVAPIEPWGIDAFQAGDESRSFRVGPLRRPETNIGEYQSQLIGLLQLVVERGTGRSAALDSFAAGKTGTSQNFRDAWFVGFSEPLVVGVWVGNDDGSPMNEVTGGSLPAQIWRAFMVEAMDILPDTNGGQRQFDLEQELPTDEEGPTLVQHGAPVQQGRITMEGAPAETASPVAGCDIQACSRRYRSFRASDCTFQPYRGPRRICDAGTGRVAAPPASQARSSFIAQGGAQAAPQSCNVHACSRAYRSFRASDCSYQPYSGPRRICDR